MASRTSERKRRKNARNADNTRKRGHDDVEPLPPVRDQSLDRRSTRAKVIDDAEAEFEAAGLRTQNSYKHRHINGKELRGLGLPTATTTPDRSQSHPAEASLSALDPAERQRSPKVPASTPSAPSSRPIADEDDSARFASEDVYDDDTPMTVENEDAPDMSEEELALTPSADDICDIYEDTYPATGFPPRAGCQDDTNVCRGRLWSWVSYIVTSDFEEKGNKCPCFDEDCKGRPTQDSMKQCTPPELDDRHLDRLFREVCREDPDYRDCLSGSCNGGHTHHSANGSLFECTDCHLRRCTTHNLPFHDGKTCEQYDEDKRKEELPEAERATNEEVEKCSVMCPGEGCGYRIQKSDGCDHITCIKCGREFCYLCSAAYRTKDKTGIWDVGNSAYEPTCPYWRE